MLGFASRLYIINFVSFASSRVNIVTCLYVYMYVYIRLCQQLIIKVAEPTLLTQIADYTDGHLLLESTKELVTGFNKALFSCGMSVGGLLRSSALNK
jgi:hypothetical protein